MLIPDTVNLFNDIPDLMRYLNQVFSQILKQYSIIFAMFIWPSELLCFVLMPSLFISHVTSDVITPLLKLDKINKFELSSRDEAEFSVLVPFLSTRGI